jgi:transcriptional regulator with XRE-family HTH domain
MPYFDRILLRRWRAESGLRIEQVCARAGIAKETLARLERGARGDMMLSTLYALAGTYQRDPRDLLLDIPRAEAVAQ